MINSENILEALSNLKSYMADASRDFDEWVLNEEEWIEPSWKIETCFFQILSIAEALKFNELHKMLLDEYNTYKNQKDGFVSHKMTPDGEPYSICLSRLRRYLKSIQSFFPQEKNLKIDKELFNIIRDIHYVITDKTLFGGPPKNENDVHIRIEGILKCLFADLKHKPTLTKSIKNFEPDTGIASIATLIEYKFLSRSSDVPTIADQILADTRGYVSNDWKRFVYVIYETNRFKSEKEWNQLLLQSGLNDNTKVVVLSGEPVISKSKKAKTKPNTA